MIWSRGLGGNPLAYLPLMPYVQVYIWLSSDLATSKVGGDKAYSIS